MNKELTVAEYDEIQEYYGSLPDIDVYPKQLKHKIISYRYFKERGLLVVPVQKPKKTKKAK